jgi:hypothetical protein
MQDTRTIIEKLQYMSETTSDLLHLSEELNLGTLSYLLRMARLEVETVELTVPATTDRLAAVQKSN